MRRPAGVEVDETDAAQGRPGELTADPSQDLKDRYGRILRYVTRISTGKDVNRRQLHKGWARGYVYNHDPFNRVDGGYRNAQRSAKAHHRGAPWR